MHKRVTFAPTNFIYSPTPGSPSPSLSFSSLPSSSSPEISTPPPPEHQPYASAPIYPSTPYSKSMELSLYDDAPSEVHIHRLLGYHPAADPGVDYDLSSPPEILEEEFQPELFMEPATSPPFATLIITHPFFVQDVTVTPTHDKGYVSVFDVLITLHRQLRLPLTMAEYAQLPLGVPQHLVDAAYFARVNRVPDPILREKERLKGVKRIDLFMGHSRFLGLSGTMHSSDLWELNVS